MKHLHFFIILLLGLSLGCTKIDKLEANNQEFLETIFLISESITYTIPNSALDFTNVTLENIGSTMALTVNENAILDQFIHAGTFQTYITTHLTRLLQPQKPSST